MSLPVGQRVPGEGPGPCGRKREGRKGEIILKDEPVIKLAVNAKGRLVDPNFMASLKDQIDSLPIEAKPQSSLILNGSKGELHWRSSITAENVNKLANFSSNAV